MHECYALLIIFLALWGGHWMPWQVIPLITNERGDLHRPLAYGYGCLCILAGFTLWAATREIGPFIVAWSAIRFLALDILAAGLGTMAPRAVKWLWESQSLRRDVAQYEEDQR